MSVLLDKQDNELKKDTALSNALYICQDKNIELNLV